MSMESVEVAEPLDPAIVVAEPEEEIVAVAEGGEPEEEEDEPQQSVQDLARTLGWKSAKDWKGKPPPGGLKTAAEYIAEHLRRGDSARGEVGKLRQALKQTTRQSAEATNAVTQRERDRVDAAYKARRADAIAAGDVAGVDKLDTERDEALKPLKAIDLPSDDDIDEEELGAQITANPGALKFFTEDFPHLQKDIPLVHAIMNRPLTRTFFMQNIWLLADDAESKDAMEYADRMIAKLLKEGAPYSLAYRKTGKMLRDDYPEYYEARQQQPAAEEEDETGAEGESRERDPETGRYVSEKLEEKPVQKPARAPVLAQPGKGGKVATFAGRLTAEEAKVADADVKDGLFKNREEYARKLFANRGERVPA